jgi:TPR repeat
MINRCWIPLVSLLLTLTACTSVGPTRNPSNEGDEEARVDLPVKPATQTNMEPKTPSEPRRSATHPLPSDDLPAKEPSRQNALPGYSSSPYGVDPIPAPSPPAANPEPDPYEPPNVQAPAPPVELPGLDISPPDSPALTPPPDPKAFNLSAPPAVMALQTDIEGNLKIGNYAEAAASLERAIRIQPKNPELWHVLADVRLKQQQLGLAEDLAKKSNLLAKSNQELIRSNWLVIAGSRRLKGDSAGASEAMDKAR